MNHEPLNYDESIEEVEIPVTWKGRQYFLREATGEAHAIYQNALMASTSMSADGSVRKITGLADAEPLLVSQCLYDAGDKQVSLLIIKKWPARIVSSLYEKAKEISEIDKEDSLEVLTKKRDRLNQLIEEKTKDKDPAKNEHSDSTDGSESHTSLVTAEV